jgi:hypothetical protein
MRKSIRKKSKRRNTKNKSKTNKGRTKKRGGIFGMNKYLPENMRMKGIGINRFFSSDSEEVYNNDKIASKTGDYDDMRKKIGKSIDEEITKLVERLQSLDPSEQVQMVSEIESKIEFYENLDMELKKLDNDRSALDFNKGEYQMLSNKLSQLKNRLNNIVDLFYKRSGYVKPDFNSNGYDSGVGFSGLNPFYTT